MTAGDVPNPAATPDPARARVVSVPTDTASNAARPDPLRYESSVAGALEPGERVIWEGRPLDAPASTDVAGLVIGMSIVPIVAMIIAVAATKLAASALLAGVVTAVPLGVIVLFMVRSRREERRKHEHLLYRVTDRRIQRGSSLPRQEVAEVALAELSHVWLERGPRRADQRVSFDGVEFAAIEEPERVQRVVLEQWSRSARRAKMRRTPVMKSPETSPAPPAAPAVAPLSRSTVRMEPSPLSPPSAAAAPHALPDGILLAPDETVIWTGRPKVWPTLNGLWVLDRLKTLAWLAIPAAVLAYHAARVRQWMPHNWIIVGVAGLWLIMGAWGMTVEPVLSARRRRRTTYVLTNVRGITHVAGPRSRTSSALLDLTGNVTLAQRGDGTGDVGLSYGAAFERIADAHVVHHLAIEAVRRAGTPFRPPPSTLPPSAVPPYDEEGG